MSQFSASTHVCKISGHVLSQSTTMVLAFEPSGGSVTYVGMPPIWSSRPAGLPEWTCPLRQQEPIPISVDIVSTFYLSNIARIRLFVTDLLRDHSKLLYDGQTLPNAPSPLYLYTPPHPLSSNDSIVPFTPSLLCTDPDVFYDIPDDP